jgi:hypothetical protein
MQGAEGIGSMGDAADCREQGAPPDSLGLHCVFHSHSRAR